MKVTESQALAAVHDAMLAIATSVEGDDDGNLPDDVQQQIDALEYMAKDPEALVDYLNEMAEADGDGETGGDDSGD